MIALPMDAYEKEFLDALNTHQYILIVGETGSGKSTRLCQFVNRSRKTCVVTQPRRFATRNVSARVAEEMGVELGTKVGYRTGFERCDSKDTEILFCTDGLELFKLLMGTFRPDICIYDEFHEMNINQEVILAHGRDLARKDPNFRLVISSATPDVKGLVEYLGNVKVIYVEGRTFPVEERKSKTGDIEAEVKALVKENRNVLVFQPGKAEIAETIEILKGMDLDAEILELHGEQTAEEQDLVFQHYTRRKVVVSSNIAQTSVTIDDIDAVVDSGYEKRIEIVDGIEGLYKRAISYACRKQRKGRAGRTREGIYVNCYTGNEEILPFPKPEIQRVFLEGLVLHLASFKIDVMAMEFFHQPPREHLFEAKRVLHLLGALDSQEELTDIGRRMAFLPVHARYARMIVEAERLEVVDDILSIVSILEVKGIVERKNVEWRRLTNDRGSDVLAQLDVLNYGYVMISDEVRVENGIHLKSYYRAIEIRAKLSDVLIKLSKKNGTWIDFNSTRKRSDIIKSIVVGMLGHLYSLKKRKCSSANGEHRILCRESIVRNFNGTMIIGEPIDIEVVTKDGMKVLNLVTMATIVNTQLLSNLAPQVTTLKFVGVEYDSSSNMVLFQYNKSFDGAFLEKVKESYTWDDIVTQRPEGLSPSKVEELIAKNIYHRATSFNGALATSEAKIGMPGKLPGERVYAVHPITQNELVAYPAVVTYGQKKSYYKIRYFFTLLDALNADVSGLVAKSQSRVSVTVKRSKTG